MKLIRFIATEQKDHNTPPSIREAVRGVFKDENNLIPILHVSKKNYHKLPGGGIDEGENRAKALERELKEEVGAEIEVLGEIGKSIEDWSIENQIQISYCYHGKIKSKGKSILTQEEKENGFQLKWLTLDRAIETIKNDRPTEYEGQLIQQRDLAFLKEYLEITKN